MTIADGMRPRDIEEKIEVKRVKSVLAQMWPLSRPAALLLAGWLGRRAVLLLPGAFVGSVAEALVVALVVFMFYAAWERLGHHLAESGNSRRKTMIGIRI